MTYTDYLKNKTAQDKKDGFEPLMLDKIPIIMLKMVLAIAFCWTAISQIDNWEKSNKRKADKECVELEKPRIYDYSDSITIISSSGGGECIHIVSSGPFDMHKTTQGCDSIHLDLPCPNDNPIGGSPRLLEDVSKRNVLYIE